jgi:nitrite reductase (NO-forming)
MNDSFWYRAWQVALLFAVVVMMGATIIAQGGNLSPADVREIIAEEGLTPGGDGAFPRDQSIRPALTPVASLSQAPADEEHVSWAPAVPPPVARSDQRVWEVHLESIEGVCPLDPGSGTSTEMWGFRLAGEAEVTCGSPGPVLRGRVGDVVNITLTNLAGNSHPHNIDFHAVTGQGGGAEGLTVNPGETATIQIRLLYPGAFMYHCAYGDVPVHIAHGMYGMFIVDPEDPLPPVDHEWAVMQSEWYVGEADASGIALFDPGALRQEHPAFVTFNGRTDALSGDNTLRMGVGERARIYFVNEGLNLTSNFHPIGSHWDLVYPEGATHQANRVIRGSQSTLVVAGGSTVVELDALVPSTVILVDHALARTFYKGAVGTIVIEGVEDPEIYRAAEPGPRGEEPPDHVDDAAAVEVIITADSYLPENAPDAYSPRELTVTVGTTVRWVNQDPIAHTVTAGTVEGSVGSPDGRFDSGFLNLGEAFRFTFTEPGTYQYFCIPHPWMQGTVTVTE